MHLEIYETVGKTGEVRFNPYSYSYDGPSDVIREFLATEPQFEEPKHVPDSMQSDPAFQEVAGELGKLRLMKQRLRNRGAWWCEIIG